MAASRLPTLALRIEVPTMMSSTSPGNWPITPSSASPSVQSLSNFQTSHCVPLVKPPLFSSQMKLPRYLKRVGD